MPEADEGRVVMNDDVRRDLRHVGAHASLGFESRAKLRAFEEAQDFRRNAAGDKYAAARPIGERDIAGHAAEERTEQIERGAAHRATAVETRAGDRRGITLGHVLSVERRDRLV